MKKIFWIMLLLLLTACAKEETVAEQLAKKMLAHTDYQTSSEYFDCQLEVVELAPERYRYDVVINHPSRSLEQITAMVICETGESDTYPAIGLDKDDVCHLDPTRIDKTNHFYEGIRLSGISLKRPVTVSVYVAFYDQGQYCEQYLLMEENQP